MTTPRAPEPSDGDERAILLGWLAFHRDALAAKCDGLSAEQLADASVPPSTLSLLGLVRHMTEMEHVYLVYALAGGAFGLIYCTDDDPEADIEGVTGGDVEGSLPRWREEREAADRVIAGYDALDALGAGNERSVRWNLVKVIGEYSRHNGHADLIRQAIDGAVGE